MTKEKLHEIIFGYRTKPGKTFDVALLIVIMLSVVGIMLDSDAIIHQKYGKALLTAEWIFTIFFTIEYILIKGVNDSLNHAKNLTKLLSSLSCKINLIPFNSFDESNYERPSNNKIKIFKDYLISKGYITTLRITRGDEVDGACGQLVGNLTKSIKGKHLISHKSI